MKKLLFTAVFSIFCLQFNFSQDISVLKFSDGTSLVSDSFSVKFSIPFFNADQHKFFALDSQVTLKWINKTTSVTVPCPGSCNRIHHYPFGFIITAQNLRVERYFDTAEKTAHTFIYLPKLIADYYENDGFIISRIKSDSFAWYGEWSKTLVKNSATKEQEFHPSEKLIFPFENFPFFPGYPIFPAGTWTYVRLKGEHQRTTFKVMNAFEKGKLISYLIRKF